MKRMLIVLALVCCFGVAIQGQDLDKAKALAAQMQALVDQLKAVLEPAPASTVVHVKVGESLQAAYDAAPDGAEISVQPGLYDGLDIRAAKVVTIHPETQALPEGLRVGPSDAGSLIGLRATLNNSSLVCRSGAKGATLRGFKAQPGADASYTVVQCGESDETDPARAAQGIVFDQWLVTGDPLKGGKHGFTLNAGQVALINSYVADFWFKEDSQAITGDNGPGPFLIENNYLEASGENILFGGASAMNQAMQPSHLTVRKNLLTKNVAWRGRADVTVKNAFELKNMDVAVIEGNVMENVWAGGQVGAAVLFTPRNQDNRTPWATVTNVTFQRNVIRHVGAGFQIQGDDDEHPSARLANVLIFQNLMYDIDPKAWNNPRKVGADGYGSGRILQVTRGPLDLMITSNTFVGRNINSFLTIDGPQQAQALTLTNNVLSEGKYAIAAPSKFGVDAWNAWVASGTLDGNLFVRTGLGATVKYPAGANVISAVGEAVTDAGFALLPKFARDGLGCDLKALPAFAP